MREEIAEQLGVTPTPGGLEVLLRQSENNRMAHGGIVHMANGGSAIKEFGQILKGIAPGIIASQMSGGLFPIIKNIAQKFGGTNVDRLQNPLASQGTSGPYNLSAYGWSPERGSGLSGSDNTRWVGMMNVGGKNRGKGAGGSYGQMQRARNKETLRMRKMMKDVARMIDPQTYIDQGFSEEAAQKLAGAYSELYGTPNMVREYFFSQNKGPSSVYGTMDELRAAGVDARPSMATSFGMPKNWEEIYKYFEEHGTFEGAPPPRAVYDESTLSSLGIRSLPPQIAQNTKPYWWPDSLPWPGDGDG